MEDAFSWMLAVADGAANEPAANPTAQHTVYDEFDDNVPAIDDVIANSDILVDNNNISAKVNYFTRNDAAEIADGEHMSKMNDIIAHMRQIILPMAPRNPMPAQSSVVVDDFDQSMNLLNREVKEKFTTELVGIETQHLTFPKLSTSTIYGMFANVSMHEADWVKQFDVDKYVLALRCNFGEKIYRHYAPPPRKIKKKKKGKPERKKQGTGTEFNSQLTFIMNSAPNDFTDDDIIPTNHLVFKIKVFRNGKIQLPGNYLHHVDQIVHCTRHIESLINNRFNVGQSDISKLAHIMSINICMKNYKFEIKHQDKQTIDLVKLAAAFDDKRLLRQSNIPHHINEVAPNTARANLSVLFKTPTYSDVNKTLRLTIEKSGKVNIKGGLYVEYSANVFALLDFIIDRAPGIVVNMYQPRIEEYNIADDRTNDEIVGYWQKFIFGETY